MIDWTKDVVVNDGDNALVVSQDETATSTVRDDTMKDAMNVTATAALGYIKLDNGLQYADWDNLR